MNKRKRLCLIAFLLTSLPLLTIIPQWTYASPAEYPVPREESLVVNYGPWPLTVTEDANPFTPGSKINPFLSENDWYYNYVNGTAIYWRITGWEYKDDSTTFILHVREGITWSDGKPYTAKDIVFTLNMLKSHPTLLYAAQVIEWVESAEAPDDYTAVLHLKKPNPRIHNWFLFGLTPIVAEHVWANVDPTTFKNYPPLTTGPYILYEVYPDLEMVVSVRRDDYWGKELGVFPAPRYIISRRAPPKDLDLLDLVNGRLDVARAHDWSWEMLRTALRQAPETIVFAPQLDGCALGIAGFNTEKYPLNLTEVRWAVSYCLNRAKLASIFPNAEKTPPSMYPWPVPQYGVFDKYVPMAERGLQRIEDELGFTYKYDPAKAAEILDGLGFTDRNGDGWRETPDGKKISWDIIVLPIELHNYIAVDLVDELRKIGINANLRTLEETLYWDAAAFGRFDIDVGALCTAAWLYGDMADALDVFHGKWYVPIGERPTGGGLWGANPRYNNTELNRIIDQLWALSPDDPEAQPLYEEGIYIMMRDMLCAPAVEATLNCPFSTAHWTGWPSEINLYMNPPSWWPSFLFVLGKIEPVKASVWMLQDVAAFTGVEGKSYGPFTAGESTTIPKADAERLIGQGVVSYSPPIAKLMTGLESLNAQIGTLMTAVVIEGVAIAVAIALAVALIITRRKPA